MIRTLILMTSLALFCSMQLSAQSCKMLYQEGNTLVDQGKLEKAKSKFQQVINCGNNLYVPDSEKRIAWINRILRKPNTVKPFSLSDNEVVIPYQGGQDVITVDGNGSWTAAVSDNSVTWCKIKKEKGKVYIVSDANEDNADRTCEVIVRMGGKSKTVTVKNEKAPELLVPSVENLTFPYKGETNTIEIRSNTNWDIKEVPSWVISVKEDGKIKLTALANDKNVERSAEIKVESTTKTIIINLHQGAGIDHLAISKNDIHFGPDGGDEYVNIMTDAQDWRFGDFPHWCQVTKVADNLLKIHCTPNDPINLNREASVNVTTGKQTLGINVSQDPKPLVAIIPNFGIGGRAISFGVNAGYLLPFINTSSGGEFTGSPVNYALGNDEESASYSSSGGFSIGVCADIRLYKNLYLMAGMNYLHYSYKNEFDRTYERKTQITAMGEYKKGLIHSKYKENYNMNILEIPILVSYRIPLSRISHLQFNIGPSISYGLNAKMKIAGGYDGENLKIYNDKTHTTSSQGGAVHFIGSGEMDLFGKTVKYSEANVIGSSDVMIPNDAILDEAPFNRLNFGAKAGIAYEYAGISFSIEYSMMLTNMANKKYWDGDRWMIFNQNAYSKMTGYRQNNHYLQIRIGYTFRY